MKFNVETASTIEKQITGSVLLTSGTITTPVEYVDLTLPDGYPFFRLVFPNIIFSIGNEFLAGAFSTDGGSTFYNDHINFDTYSYAGFSVNGTPAVSPTPTWESPTDSLLEIGAYAGGGSLPYATLDFYPGGAGSSFNAIIIANGWASSHALSLSFSSSILNPAAVISPVLARCNLIRILPYGNGDCNPPTSGETITSGSYFLWGVPTPK